MKIGVLVKESGSLRDFGEKVGVAHTTASVWISGKGMPSQRTLMRIAAAFNISVEMLTDDSVKLEIPRIQNHNTQPQQNPELPVNTGNAGIETSNKTYPKTGCTDSKIEKLEHLVEIQTELIARMAKQLSEVNELVHSMVHVTPELCGTSNELEDGTREVRLRGKSMFDRFNSPSALNGKPHNALAA